MNLISELLIVSLLFISCNENKNDSNSENISRPGEEVPIAKVDSFKTEIIFSLRCLSYTSQGYSIYLPSAYKKENPLPVIYFFDPQGAGSLPLEKYKSLAEKFNFILIGSNNSKNGLQMQESFSIATTMMNDVQERFFINASRTYVAGFSGGARVVCSLPFQNINVAGIIACSGSYNEAGKKFPSNTGIVTIAGEKDFNYHEMLSFDKSLDHVVQHQLLISQSKHEWPLEETMNDAFVFLEVNAMKNNLIPKNNSFIADYLKSRTQKAMQFETQKRDYDAWIEFKKLANVSDWVADNSQIKKEIERLRNSPSLNAYLQKESSLNQQEENMMQQYHQNFISKDLEWWENEISNLKRNAENKNDNLMAAMNTRLLGYIGIMCYTYSIKAVKMNAPESPNFLSIYKTVEPENSESYLLSSVYAANNNNISTAISELKDAIKKGFREKQRFNEFPSMINIVSQPELKIMLDTIH